MRRIRTSLESYMRNTDVQSNDEFNLPLFKAAFASIERRIYFMLSELMSTLEDQSIWNSLNGMGELGREAFIEIITASCFEVEVSYEGIPIFVLKSVIKSEELYFQQIALFLKTFLTRIKMDVFPSHVHYFLGLIDAQSENSCGRCVDGGGDNEVINPLDEDYVEVESPDKPSSRADASSTSSLTLTGIRCDYAASSEHDRRFFSRQILIYSPNELRKLDYRRRERHEKPILTSYDRFLASLRKLGMDVLFPRESHDALLSFIYAFLKETELSVKNLIIDHGEEKRRSVRSENIKIPYETTEYTSNDDKRVSHDDLQIPNLRLGDVHALTHKEMIDVVIHYQKNDDVFSGVTKTKTRGVLALLKHASAIDSFTPINDGVQITLNSSVQNFGNIRALHDRYLVAVAKQYDLELTQEEWQTLIWKKNEIDHRLLSCEAHIQKMSQYLSTLPPSIFEELAADGAANAVDDGSYSSNENRCNSLAATRLSNSISSDDSMKASASALELMLDLDPTALFPSSPCTVDSQLTESPGVYHSISSVASVCEEHDVNLAKIDVLSENGPWESTHIESRYNDPFSKTLSADSLASLIFSSAHSMNVTGALDHEENEDPRVVGSPIKRDEKNIAARRRSGLGLGALLDLNLQNHLNMGQALPGDSAKGALSSEDDDGFHIAYCR